MGRRKAAVWAAERRTPATSRITGGGGAGGAVLGMAKGRGAGLSTKEVNAAVSRWSATTGGCFGGGSAYTAIIPLLGSGRPPGRGRTSRGTAPRSPSLGYATIAV